MYVVKADVVLLNFDNVKVSHPFEQAKASNGSSQGRIEPHKYYNFDMQAFATKDWSSYQFLELDLYNPHQEGVQIFITLADNQSFDYWSQVNYVQTLSFGWNHLSLPLDQLVGERGSVKYKRKLDLKKINKFFLVIDPDKKSKFLKNDFYIDNLSLKKSIKIEKAKNIYSFDFTDQVRGNSIETEVLSSEVYSFESNPSKYYGFQNTQFFRAEDSMYAPLGLRSAIGILKGNFKVRVPNGRYKGFLVIDQLGYWDVPFYRDRTVFIQGKPLYKETRNNANEFVKDLLRFEDLDISPHVDLYSKTIDLVFKKIPFEATVVDEELVFSFSGDATGIMLNRVVFYPVHESPAGERFVQSLDKLDRVEYSKLMRSVVKKISLDKKLNVSYIEPDGALELSKKFNEEKIVKNILCQNETKNYFFEISNGLNTAANLKFNAEIKDIKNGQVLKTNGIEFFTLKNQLISPDLNHETYTIGARIFDPIELRFVQISNGEKKFFALKLTVGKEFLPSDYELVLTFSGDGFSKKYQFPFKVLNVELPPVEFPVGFMGMDALPYSYFPDAGYENIRFQYRKQVLQELASAGFTLTSGLPEVLVSYANKKFKYDSQALEKTLSEIKKYPQLKYILSYGGEFPRRLLDMNYLPQDMSKEEYHREQSNFIKRTIDKFPSIELIHTFSDEAHGYGNRIEEDLIKGKTFKTFYPFLKLGGFSTLGKGHLQALNDLFDWPFYSDTNFKEINRAKSNGVILGLYNSSQNTMDDPRFTFGVGLFMAKASGVRSYVEWSSIGFHNYPYFDLDGRESDVMLFYPKKDGTIQKSLRFVLASEGLTTFRKLQLLEDKLNKKEQGADLDKAREMFLKFKQAHYFYKTSRFMSQKDQNLRAIDLEIAEMLQKAYK